MVFYEYIFLFVFQLLRFLDKFSFNFKNVHDLPLIVVLNPLSEKIGRSRMSRDTEIPLNQLNPVIDLESLGMGNEKKETNAGNYQIPDPHTPPI